jgi:hypothetical protein
VHEARGLDVIPSTIHKFRNNGDSETADLLEQVIYPVSVLGLGVALPDTVYTVLLLDLHCILSFSVILESTTNGLRALCILPYAVPL